MRLWSSPILCLAMCLAYSTGLLRAPRMDAATLCALVSCEGRGQHRQTVSGCVVVVVCTCVFSGGGEVFVRSLGAWCHPGRAHQHALLLTLLPPHALMVGLQPTPPQPPSPLPPSLLLPPLPSLPPCPPSPPLSLLPSCLLPPSLPPSTLPPPPPLPHLCSQHQVPVGSAQACDGQEAGVQRLIKDLRGDRGNIEGSRQFDWLTFQGMLWDMWIGRKRGLLR